MACPHVSGAAALAWSTHRFPPAGLSLNVAVRRLLARTADNLSLPGRDNNFGFGRADAEQAAFEFAVPPAIPGIP
jgi:subtilisin